MVLLDFLVFGFAVFVLIQSGEQVVKNLSKIAAVLQIKPFIVAFILMALSTTLPELFVGITSALQGNPSLSLGNVIGSNIVNLTLVMGIVILIARKLKVEHKTVNKDLKYMLVIGTIPLILMIDGMISRIDGIILITIFAFYMGSVIKQTPLFHNLNSEDGGNVLSSLQGLFKHTILLIVSLIILFISANYVVESAINISVFFALPPILIGLLIISLGTSLPELTFGIKAVTSGKGDMSLGDIIGAVIVNSTLVLGVTSLITPITGNLLVFFSSAVFMVLVMFLFLTFATSNKTFNVQEGASLVLLYVFFVIIEFYLRTFSVPGGG